MRAVKFSSESRERGLGYPTAKQGSFGESFQSWDIFGLGWWVDRSMSHRWGVDNAIYYSGESGHVYGQEPPEQR